MIRPTNENGIMEPDQFLHSRRFVVKIDRWAGWLFILAVLSACGRSDENRPIPSRAPRANATVVTGQDRLILGSAEQHYTETASLAQLVADRTESQGLRTFAADLSNDTQRERTSARSLQIRLGLTTGTHPTVVSTDRARIGLLRGPAFDLAFAAAMQKKLEDGVQIGADANGNAAHPELRALGAHLVEHDRKYLARLRELEPLRVVNHSD